MRIAGLLLLATIASQAAAKAPDGAPYCAVPGTRPLFVSPMGEPFRGQPGQPFPTIAWFQRADTNHDGAIDRAEFVADADAFFRTLDRDHDGRLVPEEIIAYERDVAPEIALYSRARDMMPPSRQAPRNGESNYGGPMGAGRYAWLNIPEPVAATDGDMDRVIGAREFAASAGRRFESLDRAGTGRLTLAGLGPTFAQQALEGPCEKRPKIKKPRREGLYGPDGEELRDGPPGGPPR